MTGYYLTCRVQYGDDEDEDSIAVISETVLVVEPEN